MSVWANTRDILITRLKDTLPKEVPIYPVEPLKALGMTIPYVVVSNVSSKQFTESSTRAEHLLSTWIVEVVCDRFHVDRLDTLSKAVRSAFPTQDCLIPDGVEEIRLIDMRDVPPLENAALMSKRFVFHTKEKYA